MNQDQNREEELFKQALLRASEAERSAFLDEACRNDPSLRSRLDLLLEGHFRARGFLDTVPGDAVQSRPTAAVSPVAEEAGSRIDRYKLLQKIGEGGCGVVYMAEQEEPVRRRVALKIIKLGMDTRTVIARFEAERQALAMMDHPNIAKVFDVGATSNPLTRPPGTLSPSAPSGGEGRGEEAAASAESQIANHKSQIPSGRPYFVMELVRGVKITDYCDERNLPTQERLELFMKVCQAIQHAHQKGIIHRDIKPSNILVTVNDGVAVP